MRPHAVHRRLWVGVVSFALLSPTVPSLDGVLAAATGQLRTAPAAPSPSTVTAEDTLAAREVEPVVLTGADVPVWSRSPAEGAPEPFSGNGYFEMTRSAHSGTLTVPPDARSGVPVDEVAAYRWDGSTWTEIPFQVDERFPYFLANARSDFNFYSGVDRELTYEWAPNPAIGIEGEEAWKKMFGDCAAEFADRAAQAEAAAFVAPGQGESYADYTRSMEDPVETLDDDDELVFMASDVGLRAEGVPGPEGTRTGGDARYEVAVTDPAAPAGTGYVYLFRQSAGPGFTSDDGYVRHTRDDDADEWIDRYSFPAGHPENLGSSNTGYGPNLPGTVCETARSPQGESWTDGEPRPSTDRFPRDGMTVETDTYRAYASGRWMFRDVRLRTSDGTYGEDLVDRWKGRAFQQNPDSEISVVGFEDEQVNWEGNSALLGWRSGPVRTIREIWGADSGTNVTKTETYYRDLYQFRYRLRVHPIPPDGIYNSWDHNRDAVACYFNTVLGARNTDGSPLASGACPGGVPVDGQNDDVGNVDGAPFPADCDLDSYQDGDVHEPDGCDAYFDATDPTFEAPSAILRWEQISGQDDNGSLVYLFENNTPQSLQNGVTAIPYYRDDACFDDGTGDDPVARPWPGESSDDPRVTGGYEDLNGDGTVSCEDGETQGAHGSLGLHILVTGDTDNAHTGEPINEVDGTQWVFAVPTDGPRPVGEPYANVVRAPLVAVAVPQENLAPSGGDDDDEEPSTPTGPLTAGAAVVDATWHVGASSGQYAGEGPGSYDDRNTSDDGGVDPHLQSTTSRPTYGYESHDTVRALVMEDGNGSRWALVMNDLYIPQDLLNQRVAMLLAEHDALAVANGGTPVGITADDLTVTVSHSHSSPFYSSTSWGVWAFEDVFDIRFFEFMARKMADAVIAAAADMEPAEIGVGQTALPLTKRNPEAPTVSDDGLPAGYPDADTDPTLTVVRVERAGGDATPIANWVVFGRHPEGMEDNGLHTGEYVNNLQRIVDREHGGVTLFSQNDVGTGEIAKNTQAHPPVTRQEYDANSYQELERVARTMADHVLEVTEAIAVDDDADAADDGTVALASDVPVGVQTMRFAPPSYRLFPTVSNCRTEKAVAGNPGVPIVGLPDCAFLAGPVADHNPLPTGATVDQLRAAGVPIPDNYGGPSYTGLQETLTAQLQAVRIGEVAFTICPCEQFTDQSRNIRSRLDQVAGNLYFGWDWTANYRFHPDYEPGVAYVGDLLPDDVLGEGVRRGPAQLDVLTEVPGDQFWCEPSAGDTWTCKDPNFTEDPAHRTTPWEQWPELAPVSHELFVRWKARIYNDATGWDEYVGEDDDTPNALEAESEPRDPAQVWGNWIHEELDDRITGGGYELVVPVSMANNYWGYIPPYREFQARDYYRKALAGLGPHGADFLATRLTRMAAELKGAPETLVEYQEKDVAYQSEEELQAARAETIGLLAEATMGAYEAQLPPDGGSPRIAAEPTGEVERFGVATVRWVGGSNYTDVPDVTVERFDEDASTWVPFGTSYGEVQMELDLPDPAELVQWRAGAYEWQWTATFETYDSDIPHTFADGVTRHQVPVGRYRFRIEGCHRGTTPDGAPEEACSEWDHTGRVQPYELTSEEFLVVPWDGIEAGDLRAENGRWEVVSFDVGPDLGHPTSASNTAEATFTVPVHAPGGGQRTYTTGRFDYDSRDEVDYPMSPEGTPIEYVRPQAELRTYDAWRGGPADDELFCFVCSFETWAETGAIERAVVVVERHGSGRTEEVDAAYDPATGRWFATVDLRPGDAVSVPPGGVTDTFGEYNGDASPVLIRPLGRSSGRREDGDGVSVEVPVLPPPSTGTSITPVPSIRSMPVF